MAQLQLNRNVLPISTDDRALIRAVEHGLPIVSRPYRVIAERLGTTEVDIMARLQYLIDSGAIKRFGVVVRHRELGYRANGMVVWDVPDDDVSRLGQCIGRFPCVTLCYRRPRRLPEWPYNLFTMVHGRDRAGVERYVEAIVSRCDLHDYSRTILFSTRRFKQRGAIYSRQHRHEQQNDNRHTAGLRLIKRAESDA